MNLKKDIDVLWKDVIVLIKERHNKILWLYSSILDIISWIFKTENILSLLKEFKVENVFKNFIFSIKQINSYINEFSSILQNEWNTTVEKVIYAWDIFIKILEKLTELINESSKWFDSLVEFYFKKYLNVLFSIIETKDWNKIIPIDILLTEKWKECYIKYKEKWMKLYDYLNKLNSLKREEKRKIFIDTLRYSDISKLEKINIKNENDKNNIKSLLDFLVLANAFAEFVSILLKLVQILEENIYKNSEKIIRVNILSALQKKIENIVKELNKIIEKWIQLQEILISQFNNWEYDKEKMKDTIKNILEKKEKLNQNIKRIINETFSNIEIDNNENINTSSIKKLKELFKFIHDEIMNSELIIFYDILSLNSYFYDYDRKTESVVIMIWEEYKNIVEILNKLLNNYILMLNIFNPDDETMKRIEEWKWWILWIIESNSKWTSTYNIWRWLNLQNFKNLLILYVDNFSSEELNQIIGRMERLWVKDKKNIVLVKRTDINNEELENYISRIKELWVSYITDKKADEFIEELKKTSFKKEKKKVSDLIKDIKIEYEMFSVLDSLWKKEIQIRWLINMIRNINNLVKEEKDLSRVILKNIFTKENLVKSIIQTI